MVNDKTETDWALFGYEGQTNVLKLESTGLYKCGHKCGCLGYLCVLFKLKATHLCPPL